MKLNKFFTISLFYLFIKFQLILLFHFDAKASNVIVAIVDNKPITSIDLNEKAKLIHFSKNKNNDYSNLKDYFNESLHLLINEKLITNEAIKYNENILDLSKKDAVDGILKKFSNSHTKLNKFLESSKLSKNVFLMKYQIDLITKFLIENQFKNEIKLYSEEIELETQKLLSQQAINQIDFEEIKIYKTANFNKILNIILLDIKNGFSFRDLINKHSGKLNISGGRIGWKNQNQLPSEFFNKMFKIKEGKIVKLEDNNYVKLIRLIAKRKKGERSSLEEHYKLLKIVFNYNGKNKELKFKTLDGLINENTNNFNCLKIRNKINKINGFKSSILKIRLADLNNYFIDQIKIKKLKDILNPIYFDGVGLTFLLCDKTQPKNLKLVLNSFRTSLFNNKMNFLRLKLIKKLKKNAIIEIKSNLDAKH